MYSGGESDAEPMYMQMLEQIRGGSQSCPSVNSVEERYKLHDYIKQIQAEWKGAILSTQNVGKGLQKVFKAVVNENFQFF